METENEKQEREYKELCSLPQTKEILKEIELQRGKQFFLEYEVMTSAVQELEQDKKAGRKQDIRQAVANACGDWDC